MKNHKISRVAALLGAFALSTAAMMGGGAAAFAEAPSFGNIDFTKTGSLTVHKYLHQAVPGATTGDISAPPAAGDFTDPVQGVEFTVYPLLKAGAAIDLTIPTTWDSLNTITPGAACTAPAGYSLGAGTQMPMTDAAGLAKLTLPIGVYQVCETVAPSFIVDKALPFILTVPMPHAKGWVYDVHAYPKNGKGGPEKTVETLEDGNGIGSTVNFPVSMVIPKQANDWTKFTITDALEVRLAPKGTGVKSVQLKSATAPTTTTDIDPSYYAVSKVGNTVTMALTPAGITWLNAAPKDTQAGKSIVVVFTTTVVSLGDGVIKNKVQFSNGPGHALDSAEVSTTWGSIEIQKRAEGTTGTTGLLKDAEFEVYNATVPYAVDCKLAVADEAAGPITAETKVKFVSDVNGVVTIPGLFVSDSTNAPINALQRCYVLKEIKAPAGYVLPAQPFTGVTVKAGHTPLTAQRLPEIINKQQTVPELPLTGAAGQVLLITVGIAGVTIAGGLMLMNRRRTRAKA